jgi:hypothetical protein
LPRRLRGRPARAGAPEAYDRLERLHLDHEQDVRIACDKAPLCYDFSADDKYMASAATKAAQGVPEHLKWKECDGPVHSALMADWMADLELGIPATLAAGVRVLIYAGDKVRR